MAGSEWGYQHEKFYDARRALLLPHPQGEEESIVVAFHECMHGLKGVKREDLDDHAKRWFDIIQDAMNTDGLEAPAGGGTWAVKASKMTNHERSAFADAVDQLATWFTRRAHGDGAVVIAIEGAKRVAGVSATPFRWRTPDSVPLRPWVYGRQLLRGTVSVLIAPGATGKTAMLIGTALAALARSFAF